MAGETGPIIGQVSLPIAMIIGGFFAIACYNSIEIFIFVLRTFKRRNGLYYYSMMAANCGIPIHALGALLRFFALAPNFPMTFVISVGWFLMVTGQALVLYSRMHLVVGDPCKIRWVLGMIAFVFFIIQVPTAVLFIGSNIEAPSQSTFARIFGVYENIQIATITLQEMLLSGLYVYEAAGGLRLMDMIKGPKVRALKHKLIALFILVVALDVTLMVAEYTDHFQIQTTYKPVVYSIKLKVEALVLTNLISLVQSDTSTCAGLHHIGSSNNYSLSTRSESTAVPPDSNWPYTQTQENASSIRAMSAAVARIEDWGVCIYDGRPPDPKTRAYY